MITTDPTFQKLNRQFDLVERGIKQLQDDEHLSQKVQAMLRDAFAILHKGRCMFRDESRGSTND